MMHYLKTIQPYYDEVESGRKTFEIRVNDRDYKIGDILTLQEWTGTDYTGKFIAKQVTYILDDPQFVPSGYVCMSIQDIEKNKIKIYLPCYECEFADSDGICFVHYCHEAPVLQNKAKERCDKPNA